MSSIRYYLKLKSCISVMTEKVKLDESYIVFRLQGKSDVAAIIEAQQIIYPLDIFGYITKVDIMTQPRKEKIIWSTKGD